MPYEHKESAFFKWSLLAHVVKQYQKQGRGQGGLLLYGPFAPFSATRLFPWQSVYVMCERIQASRNHWVLLELQELSAGEFSAPSIQFNLCFSL